MVSQNAIPSKKHLGGAFPYVFTEQGVAMLSAVLRSDIAIKVSIQIMDAFVKMRKFVLSNADVYQRLTRVEYKQLELDNDFNKLFNSLNNDDISPKQGVFYQGDIFDAYVFVSKLIKSARKSITLVDNYVDESVLTLFSKRNVCVKISIYTKSISKQLNLEIKKFNLQYSGIEVRELNGVHDRFLIIDDKVYHIGASLKDLGKKLFAFSKLGETGLKILEKLRT